MFSGLFLYLISPRLNPFSCESVLRIFTAFNDSVAQGVNERAVPCRAVPLDRNQTAVLLPVFS